jgi:hypothetical protein
MVGKFMDSHLLITFLAMKCIPPISLPSICYTDTNNGSYQMKPSILPSPKLLQPQLKLMSLVVLSIAFDLWKILWYDFWKLNRPGYKIFSIICKPCSIGVTWCHPSCIFCSHEAQHSNQLYSIDGCCFHSQIHDTWPGFKLLFNFLFWEKAEENQESPIMRFQRCSPSFWPLLAICWVPHMQHDVVAPSSWY